MLRRADIEPVSTKNVRSPDAITVRSWVPVMARHILQTTVAAACILFGLASAASIDVGKYKTHELTFTAGVSPANPFDTYLLRLEITDPAGRKFNIDGFYDGDGNGGQSGRIWKARMTPYMTGVWSWRTIPGDAPDEALAGLSGQFRCLDSGDLGGVIVQGQHFRFQEGPYIYLQGNFLDLTAPSTHVYMSEKVSDAWRDFIIVRNRDFHAANKINVYFANEGDYRGLSVTPWLGSPSESDKTRMDLGRWKLYDQYVRRFKDAGMFAEMWFFADDSKFGKLSDTIKNRLFRYAMARTSAFTHTMYVIALEWEEGWSRSSVIRSGDFIQSHNPWRRPLSVHSVVAFWSFSGARWASFIASQAGNKSRPHHVYQAAVALRLREKIPHIGEEFGLLSSDSDERLRANLWANFLGGAAGGGTGSDLKAFQGFLSQSRVPFQRMAPASHLVEEGGSRRFLLAEIDHHYVVYSLGGAFKVNIRVESLPARWFDPRDPNARLGNFHRVSAGTQTFVPPHSPDRDWVLWISDGTNLNSGTVRPSTGATLTQELINLTSPSRYTSNRSR
jgi:Domain of unknown function (DUF5060)/Putative collagen-binding domain of a collagenase